MTKSESKINKRPETTEEAFAHGAKSHTEGLNPFRNLGVEHYKLNNAWHNGFESRKK